MTQSVQGKYFEASLQTYRLGAHFKAFNEAVLMLPSDSRYTQVVFNLQFKLLKSPMWRIQSVSESWVCHFAVDAEMVSKNQFYHMERDWFGAKNWPLVAEFLNVATFIEEKLSKKGFGNFSIFSKSLGEKTWNQNSEASFGMTLLFCFQNFVL